MSFGDDTLDPSNAFPDRCPSTIEVKRNRCIGIPGHIGAHVDGEGREWTDDSIGRQTPTRKRPPTPLATAALVTGLTQEALESLHALTTYELSSATAFRHRGSIEQVRKQLTEARNLMAGLSLAFGKEGVA